MKILRGGPIVASGVLVAHAYKIKLAESFVSLKTTVGSIQSAGDVPLNRMKKEIEDLSCQLLNVLLVPMMIFCRIFLEALVLFIN